MPRPKLILKLSLLLIRFIIAAALVLAVNAGYAERTVDLYEYSTVVESQRSADRDQAIKDGFAEIMVRVSGKPSVLNDDRVIAEMRRAENYFLSFAYQDYVEPKPPLPAANTLNTASANTPAPRTAAKTKWTLAIKYSRPLMEQLLRDLQLSFWPPSRPSTLVWMVIDEGINGRQFVTQDKYPQVIEAVKASGVRRGVPLDFPRLDLEDQVALPLDRLWNLDMEQINSASVRYPHDSILIGRLTLTNQNEWRSAWTLLHKNENEVFDGRNVDINSVAATIINQVAEFYVNRYGLDLSSNTGETVVAVVHGIDDFSDYINVLKYVDDLAIVRRADLIQVFDNRLLLNIYSEGGRNLFIETLALDKKLNVDRNPVQDTGSGIEILNLNWTQ